MMRKPIDPEIKLAITLRFLATGESYESLMYQFRVHSCTIAKFIPVVCSKIYETFKGQFLRLPNTTEEWGIIEHETRRLWQFPNCIGATDGKHVAILHPSNSGSEFCNYKGFLFQSFYLLLLIIITSSFLPMFDVKGELVVEECTEIVFFYKAKQENLLDLPPDKPLPVSNNPYYDRAKILSQCHMFSWQTMLFL